MGVGIFNMTSIINYKTQLFSLKMPKLTGLSMQLLKIDNSRMSYCIVLIYDDPADSLFLVLSHFLINFERLSEVLV